MGPFGIGPLIPYRSVKLLKVGTLAAAADPRKATRDGTLLIYRSPLRRYKLELDFADAERCFEALRGRCPNAVAVDLLHEDARDQLPANPDAVPSARRRLRRYWAAAGVLFLLIGASPYLVVWLRGYDSSSLQAATDTVRALHFLAYAPAILAFGWFALRRARRHHRSIKGRR